MYHWAYKHYTELELRVNQKSGITYTQFKVVEKVDTNLSTMGLPAILEAIRAAGIGFQYIRLHFRLKHPMLHFTAVEIDGDFRSDRIKDIQSLLGKTVIVKYQSRSMLMDIHERWRSCSTLVFLNTDEFLTNTNGDSFLHNDEFTAYCLAGAIGVV